MFIKVKERNEYITGNDLVFLTESYKGRRWNGIYRGNLIRKEQGSNATDELILTNIGMWHKLHGNTRYSKLTRFFFNT